MASGTYNSGRPEAAVKASTNAANHGLPPLLGEKDPILKTTKNAQSFNTIWGTTDSYDIFINMKHSTDNTDEKISRLSSGKIWKQLHELQINRSNIASVEQKGDTLVFKVSNRQDASKLISCTRFCEIPVKLEPHSTLNSSKGVVKNSWLKNSKVDEMEELDGVTKAEQMTIKRDGKIVKTGTWILTFNTPTCPLHMDIYWIRGIEVQVFIPKPMRCFKCQRFGHQTKHCRSKTDVCARCGAHEKHQNCSATPKCPNCNGNHEASDKSCPEYTKTAAILEHRATHGGTFASAREALYPVHKTYSSVLRNKNNQNQNVKNPNAKTQNVKNTNVKEVPKTANTLPKVDSDGYTLVSNRKRRKPFETSSSAPSGGASPSSSFPVPPPSHKELSPSPLPLSPPSTSSDNGRTSPSPPPSKKRSETLESRDTSISGDGMSRDTTLVQADSVDEVSDSMEIIEDVTAEENKNTNSKSIQRPLESMSETGDIREEKASAKVDAKSSRIPKSVQMSASKSSDSKKENSPPAPPAKPQTPKVNGVKQGKGGGPKSKQQHK